jgi:hypothetical protein
MTSVNHLKNQSAQQKYLTVAFGLQAVVGHLLRSKATGGDPFQMIALNALGEGEWDGCLGAYYRGIEIPAADYNFHPGALATAMETGTQIVDSFFDLDLPHSRTAMIGYKCPAGIGSTDTRENPPLDFKGIFRTKKCLDFDDAGEATGFSYSPNPARVLVQTLLQYGRLPNLPAAYDSHVDYWLDRIDWPVWDAWRNYLEGAEEVDYRTWEGLDGFGLTAQYYNGTSFDTFVAKFVLPVINIQSASAPPAGGVTPSSFSAIFEGFVKTTGAGEYTFTCVHTEGVRVTLNGSLRIDEWSSTGTHSSSAIELDGDTFYPLKVEWKNTTTTASLSLSWSGGGNPAELIPTKNLYPKVEDRPRYEAHVYFDTPTNYADAMRQVLLVSNSIMQDVDGKLRFYCLEQLESTFELDDSNIDKFKFRRRDILIADPITAYESSCRDLDSQFLEEMETPVRVELTNLSRKNAENIKTVTLYNMTRWQARKVLQMRAKLEVEYDLVLEIEGKTAKTYPVVAGDVITVSHRKINGDPADYLVREVTESGVSEATGEQGKDPESRTFVLQNWN